MRAKSATSRPHSLADTQPLKARLAELLDTADGLEKLKDAVGIINPRLPGWRNDLLQFVKTSLARALAWYTRPVNEFNGSVSRALEEMASALVVLQTRLAHSERRNEVLARSMQEQLKTSNSPQETAILPSPAGMNARFRIDTRLGNDRTAYVIGLFGSGRQYVCELILLNIGERADYFRDRIRLHPGPTPMIYSGHATLRHVSRGQNLPEITSRVLDGVKAGFADLIFVYRHPLDSLLTNWIWWRAHIREERCIAGISQIYEKTEDLCADLEKNFAEFRAFADGDPDFFAGAPLGPRFLSFAEFVEETELYIESDATLKLRFEDFTIDPLAQFSKIVDVMSIDLDWSEVRVTAPRSKAYGYLAVKQRVPRFEKFIDGLDAETKRRMEKIGYEC